MGKHHAKHSSPCAGAPVFPSLLPVLGLLSWKKRFESRPGLSLLGSWASFLHHEGPVHLPCCTVAKMIFNEINLQGDGPEFNEPNPLHRSPHTLYTSLPKLYQKSLYTEGVGSKQMDRQTGSREMARRRENQPCPALGEKMSPFRG